MCTTFVRWVSFFSLLRRSSQPSCHPPPLSGACSWPGPPGQISPHVLNPLDGLVTCFLAWFHGCHFNLSGRKVGLVCHSIGHGEFQEDVSQPCATSFNICSGPGFQTQALFEMRQVCIDRKMIYAYFTGWYSYVFFSNMEGRTTLMVFSCDSLRVA